MNDRNALFCSLVIVSSRFMAEYKTTQKIKVGITHISGCNANFSRDIKRRT